jgi:hypothetical protein
MAPRRFEDSISKAFALSLILDDDQCFQPFVLVVWYEESGLQHARSAADTVRVPLRRAWSGVHAA